MKRAARFATSGLLFCDISHVYLALKDKTRVPLFLALFPNCDDLFNGDIANLIFIILKLQDAVFHVHHFASQSRSAGTDNVDFATNKF